MAEIKPNHICKNRNCNKGSDGGRNHYYACNHCDKSFNWRSVACSFDCYQEYMKQVLDERFKNVIVDTSPERTDMSKVELSEMLQRPAEEILAATKEELSEYIQENENSDIAEIIDNINRDIKKKSTSRIKK